MKDFRSLIEDVVNNRERHKKQLAAVISLSVLVSFAVPMVLTEPAVSQTRLDMVSNDILASQLFNDNGSSSPTMIRNLADTKSLSDVNLLIGEGRDWATGCTTPTQVSKKAQQNYVLGIASDFCVFLENDFKPSKADAEGRVAVGGNIEFTQTDNYQIGAGDFESSTPLVETDNYYGITNFAHIITNGNKIVNVAPYTTTNGGSSSYTQDPLKRIVIPKSLDIDAKDDNNYISYHTNDDKNGHVPYDNEGHSHYTGKFNEREIFYQVDNLINFSNEFKFLRGQSKKLSNVPTTEGASVNYDANSKTLNLTVPTNFDDEILYFNIDSLVDSDGVLPEFTVVKVDGIISEKTNIIISCNATSFNLKGTYTYINGKDISSNTTRKNNHKFSENILYNFSEATSGTIQGNFNGTVLAPNADITGSDGHLSGALIAKSFSGSTEFGYRPYRGPVNAVSLQSGYVIPVNKIDSSKKLLAGAKFNIYEVVTGSDDEYISNFVSKNQTVYTYLPSAVDYSGETEYAGNFDLTILPQEAPRFKFEVPKTEQEEVVVDVELAEVTEPEAEETTEELTEPETEATTEEVVEDVTEAEETEEAEEIEFVSDEEIELPAVPVYIRDEESEKVAEPVVKTYKIVEQKAPDGFVKTDKYYTVQVSENIINAKKVQGEEEKIIVIPTKVTTTFTITSSDDTEAVQTYSVTVDDTIGGTRSITIGEKTFDISYSSGTNGSNTVSSIKCGGTDISYTPNATFTYDRNDYYYDAKSMMIMPVPTSKMTFVNQAGFYFKKVDAVSGNILSGANINMYVGDTNDKVSETTWKWSGSDCTVDINNLAEDIVYRIQEDTPPHGYKKADSIYIKRVGITIQTSTSADGQYETASVENGVYCVSMEDQKNGGADIRIEKYNTFFNAELGDAKFNLCIKNDTSDLVIVEDITVPKGGISLKEFIKTNSGNVRMSTYFEDGLLKPGTYYLEEKSAPKGYEKSNKKWYFTVKDEFPNFAVISGEEIEKEYNVNFNSGNECIFIYNVPSVSKIEITFANSSDSDTYTFWATAGGIKEGVNVTASDGKLVLTSEHFNSPIIDFTTAKIVKTGGQLPAIKSIKFYAAEESVEPAPVQANVDVFNIKQIAWTTGGKTPDIEKLTLYYSNGTSKEKSNISAIKENDYWKKWDLSDFDTNNVIGLKIEVSGNITGHVRFESSDGWLFGTNDNSIEIGAGNTTLERGTQGLAAENIALKLKVEDGIDVDTIKVANREKNRNKTVSIEKVWGDSNNKFGVRPESINVELYQTQTKDATTSGTKVGDTITLNEANEWKWSSTVLAYDDTEDENPYYYYFKEVTVPTYYNVTANPVLADATTGAATITNTIDTSKSIEFEKIWDKSGVTNVNVPTEIKVNLQCKKPDTSEWKTIEENVSVTKNGNGKWEHTFNKLVNDLDYQVVEVNVPDGWTASGGVAVDGKAIITNTFEGTSLNVEKIWDDTGNHNKPENVYLKLYRSTTAPENITPAPSSAPKFIRSAQVTSDWTNNNLKTDTLIEKNVSGGQEVKIGNNMHYKFENLTYSNITKIIVNFTGNGNAFSFAYDGMDWEWANNNNGVFEKTFNPPKNITYLDFWDLGNLNIQKVSLYGDSPSSGDTNDTTGAADYSYSWTHGDVWDNFDTIPVPSEIAGKKIVKIKVETDNNQAILRFNKDWITGYTFDNSNNKTWKFSSAFEITSWLGGTGTGGASIKFVHFWFEDSDVKIKEAPEILTEGTPATFTASKDASWTVTWADGTSESISEYFTFKETTDSKTFTITPTKYTANQIKVTATAGGTSDKKTVSVTAKEITITPGNSINVRSGGTATFNITPYDDATISDGLTIVSDGTVTIENVTASQTITVSRHDKTATVNINVVGELAIAPGYNPSATINSTQQLSVINNTEAVTWASSNPSIATVDANGLVTFKDFGDVTITATENGGQTASVEFTVARVAAVVTLPTGAEQVGGLIELNNSNGWQKTINKLEKKDASGNTYYYYIVEVDKTTGKHVSEVSGSDGSKYIPVSYTNGLSVVNEGTVLSVTNKYTGTDDNPTSMPSTGGTGTQPYTAAGMIIVSGAFVMLVLSKRRRTAK